MFFVAVLLASGLAGLGEASAEPVAQFGCVIDQLSAADRRGHARTSLDRAAEAALTDRVRASASACAARYGWAEARQRLAGAYSLAAIARDRLRAHLAANRIDVAVIDDWAESYSDWSDAMDNDDVAILYTRLANAGASPERIARFTEEIGQYLAARETIAAIRLGRPLPHISE